LAALDTEPAEEAMPTSPSAIAPPASSSHVEASAAEGPVANAIPPENASGDVENEANSETPNEQTPAEFQANVDEIVDGLIRGFMELKKTLTKKIV